MHTTLLISQPYIHTSKLKCNRNHRCARSSATCAAQRSVSAEVFEKVLACNVRFFQIAVEGQLDGRPPWKRHVVPWDSAGRTVYMTKGLVMVDYGGEVMVDDG